MLFLLVYSPAKFEALFLRSSPVLGCLTTHSPKLGSDLIVVPRPIFNSYDLGVVRHIGTFPQVSGNGVLLWTHPNIPCRPRSGERRHPPSSGGSNLFTSPRAPPPCGRKHSGSASCHRPDGEYLSSQEISCVEKSVMPWLLHVWTADSQAFWQRPSGFQYSSHQ